MSSRWDFEFVAYARIDIPRRRGERGEMLKADHTARWDSTPYL